MVPSRSRGSKPPPSVGHPAGDGFRILCLEAGAAEAARIADLLKDAFLPVTVTWVDGRQALENALAPGWTFDLLLVAFTLPERAGEAALAWFRKRFPAAPAIVLAGPMEVGGILECLRMGATDCVPQASLALLAPAVRRALEEARRAEAEREAEHANRRLLGLLRATLEATQEGVLVTDLAGRITTYNRKFMALCGIPEYVMAPMQLDRVLQFLQDQFLDPKAFLSEARMLGQHPELSSVALLDGGPGRLLEAFRRPQRVGSETVGQVLSVVDMAARRPAPPPPEAAGLPRELLEAAQADWVVPWFLTDDGLVIGEKGMKVLDLPREGLPVSLQALEARIHPDDLDSFRHGLEQPLAGPFELRLRRSDGSWIRTRWNLKKGMEGLQGIFTELTGEPAAGSTPAHGSPGPRFCYDVKV